SVVMSGIAGILRGRPGLCVREAGVGDLCAPGFPAPALVLYDVAAVDAAQVLACLAAAPAIVGLDLRRDRAVTLMGEFYPLATVDDLAALFVTLGIEAPPALPAQPGP
ncbi:MAG: hypothetical protein KDD91_09345, partial [Caldilinea sp.]|nr:hypothetical protein [Caldilinea sp.]